MAFKKGKNTSMESSNINNGNYFNKNLYNGSGIDGLFQILPFLRSCKKVLDFGCGTGDFLELLKENGINGEGYDILEESRDIVEKKGFVFHRTLPDLSNFDALTMFSVIEHLTPKEVMTVLKNFANSGGVVCITTPDPRSYNFILYKSFWDDFSHIRPYTSIALRRLLIYCGYEILLEDRRKRGSIIKTIQQKLLNRKNAKLFKSKIDNDESNLEQIHFTHLLKNTMRSAYFRTLNCMLDTFLGIKNPALIIGKA